MYYYIKFKICQTMIKLNRLFTGLFLSAHLLVQSQIHEMNISSNYGADGGLYAELIKNRSFEFH